MSPEEIAKVINDAGNSAVIRLEFNDGEDPLIIGSNRLKASAYDLTLRYPPGNKIIKILTSTIQEAFVLNVQRK